MLVFLGIFFQFVEYLQNESLYIEVWGRQKVKGQKTNQPAPKAVKVSLLKTRTW